MTDEKLKNPKIEKAEILEYTVEFLQSRVRSSEVQEELNLNLQSGFQRCLQTTMHFINSTPHLSHVSGDLLFRQLSSLNLSEKSSKADQDSVHLYKPLPLLSHSTSPNPLCPSNSPIGLTNNVADVQGEWNSDQTGRSWRPWV
ncbi:transcription factor HES-7.1-A-like [Mixophyes fleayi]|uniref:transcription factor HES-7.1-A-like n=1 Tax=Mixophyes fleayi TaxID=3061075 RepID=UPI003F4DBC87